MTISQRQISTAVTASAENNTHHVKITKKKQLFLLFYTTQNHRGDDLMYFSAKTRRHNIEKASWFDPERHLIFNVPIQDIAEIINTVASSIQKRGVIGKVEIKEVNIFSHAWYDGPTGSVSCSVEPEGYQMKLAGWSLIDFQWAAKSRFAMFGCNTATDEYNSRVFAEDLSNSPNFKDVEVWGQTSPAKPSFYPDQRDSSVLRNMDTGWSVNFTYMVASTKGDGWAATRGIPKKSPPAMPMKKYINGVLIERAFQSQFNDHRKL